LDVNGGWSLAVAKRELKKFSQEFSIDYVEQPCAEIFELEELAATSEVAIAVDESIRKNLSGDLSKLANFAQVAIIKWQPTGGQSAALKLASEIKLPVVISSALETGVGISHGAKLAAAIPNLYGACGLGTVSLLSSDITGQNWQSENGFISPQPAEVDLDLAAKFAASRERVEFWRERAERIWSLHGGISWLQ
jgi:O-succinylbenzoate synthase